MPLNFLWTEYTENSLQSLLHPIHREFHTAINKTPHTSHSSQSRQCQEHENASWCMQKIPSLMPLYHCPQSESQGKPMMHLPKKVAAKMKKWLIKTERTIYFMVSCALGKFWRTEDKLNNDSFCALRTMPSKITDRTVIGPAGISTN